LSQQDASIFRTRFSKPLAQAANESVTVSN
jgi:hypothetical protein